MPRPARGTSLEGPRVEALEALAVEGVAEAVRGSRGGSGFGGGAVGDQGQHHQLLLLLGRRQSAAHLRLPHCATLPHTQASAGAASRQPSLRASLPRSAACSASCASGAQSLAGKLSSMIRAMFLIIMRHTISSVIRHEQQAQGAPHHNDCTKAVSGGSTSRLARAAMAEQAGAWKLREGGCAPPAAAPPSDSGSARGRAPAGLRAAAGPAAAAGRPPPRRAPAAAPAGTNEHLPCSSDSLPSRGAPAVPKHCVQGGHARGYFRPGWDQFVVVSHS